jgi:DNA-binding winged helix-turn-helix (wHTH) protein
MSLPHDSSQTRPSGYTFGDVQVDALRRTVSVAGEEVACRPLVFQLLLLLCEARGAVVERTEILERLWPESAVPSDESLTQIAHRLRGTLGASGGALRTVRGVGFRLDAAVEPVFAEPGFPEPAPPAAELGAAPVPSPSIPVLEAPAPPRRRAGLAAGLALLAVAVVAALAWTVWRWDPVLDSGYDLRRSDLGTSRDDTAELIRRAIVIRGEGDRMRARTLLETADRTDRTSPIAAALLALSDYGNGAETWADEAERRLKPDATAYQRLLVHYAGLSRVSENPESVATLSALLEIRPNAWALRLARAHFHLARRERAAALADLQGIPIHRLSHRGMAIVLADRASLGDAAGAERDLRSGRLESEEEALAAFVRARIRRSQRRPAEARREVEHAIDEATKHNEPDLAKDCRLLAGITAYESGDPAAAALWLDEFTAEPGASNREEAVEALGVGAYLAQRRSDLPGRDRRLADAHRRLESQDPRMVEPRIGLELLALRLGEKPSPALHQLAGQIASEPELLGVRSLLQARLAFEENHPAEAARLLRQARLEGLDQTYFADEAAVLAADLGEPPAALWIDPPYPYILRFAAVWELDGRRARR